MLGGNLNHLVEDRVPSACCFQFGIWEHASIPTDMLDTTFVSIFEPVLRALNNIKLAIRIVSQTMLAGFVVASGAMHMTIVLSDVKVNRPRSKLIGHLGIGGIKFV